MKRVGFTVKTVEGDKRIMAWQIGNGVYVHRFVGLDFDYNPLLSKTHWSISAECGMSIKQFTWGHDGRHKFKEVVGMAKRLSVLDWSKLDGKSKPSEEYIGLFNKVVQGF